MASTHGPRTWQAGVLNEIASHLKNSETRFTPLRIAVASGHGIGKSSLAGMVMHWALSTCVDCRITITANTGSQLATKTVPEVSKWFNLSINKHWFDVKATSISVKIPERERTWRADYIAWSENNSEAFAGLHNERKRIVIIFDEASAIADIIWDVTQGALTDEQTEIIWLAFGNPTQNQGRFAEAFGIDRARWKCHQIDSRTVEGTNKTELNDWVEKYGEDSDYIRVRVRGEFPRRGTAQFIGHDVVAAARRYKAVGYEHLPKILTCDVARFGDNQTVFGLRQGRRFDVLEAHRGLDTVQTTDRAIELIKKGSPDAIVIDGDGIGGAVVDGLKHRGYNTANGFKVFEFHGGETAFDPKMYFNRRTECWGLMRDWLTLGAQIPDDADMERELTGPNYHIVQGKVQNGSIILESKEDMRQRGVESPDKGDALAMSFSVKLAPKSPARPPSRPPTSWS